MADSDLTHNQGMMPDIERRRELENELSDLKEKFSVLVDDIQEAIIVADEHGNVSFWNRGATEMFGYEASEACGRALTELIVPDDQAEAHRRGFEQAVSTGPGSLIGKTVQLRAKRKNGTDIDVELSLTLSNLAEEWQSVGVIRDISERIGLEMQLSRLDRALRAHVRVNEIIVHSETEAGLLDRICEALVESGGYQLVWIGYAQDDENKTVRPVAQAGFDESYMKSIEVSWADVASGRGPTGTAIRTGEIMVARDIHNDPNHQPWRDNALQHGYKSSISLPLRVDREILGAVNLYSSEPGGFSIQEVELLEQLTADTAFGIYNRRSLIKQTEYREALSLSLVATIRAMASTVEKRDPYTAGHMDRVAQLAVAIAKEMGWDDERAEGLNLAASIHDLGKIYIPSEILNRPGEITDLEFEMIKTHSQVGFDIIKDIKFLWPIAETILQHHERLDGSGYPKGLKGDEILIESQVLAVADVVEAISAHRPYRPALGLEKALDEIKKNSGICYNPEVVETCVKIIRDGFEFT